MIEADVVLITRTFNSSKIVDFIKKIEDCELINKIIILINQDKDLDFTPRQLITNNFKCSNKLEIVNIRPWGVASGALNIGITESLKYKPKFLLFVSPQISISSNNIKKMKDYLIQFKEMLVVGYTLENGQNTSEKSEVFRIPWNTCAMWNTQLFIENIGAFSPICDSNEFLGKVAEIKLHGMEDALAMALAQTKNPSLEIGLIEGPLKWEIDPSKMAEFSTKMKRKPLVYDKYKEIFKGFNPLIIKNLT